MPVSCPTGSCREPRLHIEHVVHHARVKSASPVSMLTGELTSTTTAWSTCSVLDKRPQSLVLEQEASSDPVPPWITYVSTPARCFCAISYAQADSFARVPRRRLHARSGDQTSGRGVRERREDRIVLGRRSRIKESNDPGSRSWGSNPPRSVWRTDLSP